MIKKMCCCDHEINEGCIMDTPDFYPGDCVYIHELLSGGKGKQDCPEWKDVYICEECGHMHIA